MAEFMNTVDILGDDAVVDTIIDRSIVEYADDSITTVGAFAFSYCTALSKVDFLVVGNIADYAFDNCSKLTTLILRNTSKVATLSSNAFYPNLITSGKGYIYVPSALVDSYKAATNWSRYAAQLRAIEDYPEITGG
jgi:hypothetical protein